MVATRKPDDDSGMGRLKRLSKEPIVHFFVIGVLLFAVHRLVVGDPRTIVVSSGLKAELSRRFTDHGGQRPTQAELDAALRDWKRDEALYREALHERLDEDDATIRKVLADKLRARLALEVPKRKPSDAELEAWFETHEKLYATPLRYECEWSSFPKGEASTPEELEKYERVLKEGGNPSSAARPIFARVMTADELGAEFGASLAERIQKFPVGAWQRAEVGERSLLVRLKRVEGGIPDLKAVKPLVIADWTRAYEDEAIERLSQQIVERYRFEERP